MADGLPEFNPRRALRPHLALIAEAPQVSHADLLAVAAAVQRQLVEDVAPFWGVAGTVSVFETLDAVPPSYWPVIVSDQFTFPMHGFHEDEDGRPLALIKYHDTYSQAVSHEAIETVVDSDGARTVKARALADANETSEYLLEVCDPCETQGYVIDGVLVSDFYTPRYFDDERRPGVQYSYTGAVSGPRDILDGGYLTWRESTTGRWWQHRRFGDDPGSHPLDLPQGGGSLRAKVDSVTKDPLSGAGAPKEPPARAEAWERLLREASDESVEMHKKSKTRAARLRQQIAAIQCDRDAARP